MKSHTTIISRALLVPMLGAAIFSGFAARAADAAGRDSATVTVKYGDLDLSHPQGASALYGRIRAAAEKVCAPRPWFANNVRDVACINAALSEAVATVRQPGLTALYRNKKGPSQSTRVAGVHS